jgi:hypothetical protein
LDITEEHRRGLNIALNDAEILGFEVDPYRRFACATFNVLTMPENGPPPIDRRVQMLFNPVGRVAASFWCRESDEAPWEVTKFKIKELLKISQDVGRVRVCGWNFIDINDKTLRPSEKRLSLEWESGMDGRAHSITVSPLGRYRALDLSVWFDVLEIRLPSGVPERLEDFIAGGKRWWDALHAGDDRTKGFGIVPGSPPGYGNLRCPGCNASIFIGKDVNFLRCTECGAEFHR